MIFYGIGFLQNVFVYTHNQQTSYELCCPTTAFRNNTNKDVVVRCDARQVNYEHIRRLRHIMSRFTIFHNSFFQFCFLQQAAGGVRCSLALFHIINIITTELNKYKDALAAGIKVNPLLISTAGTMHKAMHKFFKKTIPNANQRSCVLI